MKTSNIPAIAASILAGLFLAPDVLNAATLSASATAPVVNGLDTGAYGTNFVVETSETLTGTWAAETSPGNVTLTGNDVTHTFPSPLVAKKFVRLRVVVASP